MPYVYQLENRRRVKRAVVACLILGALALLILAPARMLGWAGMGFATLEPASQESLVVEKKTQGAAAKASPPPFGLPTFPAFAEWSDVSALAPCVGCDSLWALGIDGSGDLVTGDNASVEGLEPASSLGSGGASGFRRFGGASRSRAGGSGGAGGGGGSGGGSASGSAPAEAAAAEGASESATEAVLAEALASEPAASVSAASTVPGSTGGGSGHGDGPTPNNPSGGNNAGGNPTSGSTADDDADESSPGAIPGTGQTPSNLLLGDLPAFAPEQGGPGADDPLGPLAPAMPADVERALLDLPAGTETVISPGDPEVVGAALNLDGGSGDQQATIPEPSSLLLMGLALSSAAWRKRHSRA